MAITQGTYLPTGITLGVKNSWRHACVRVFSQRTFSIPRLVSPKSFSFVFFYFAVTATIPDRTAVFFIPKELTYIYIYISRFAIIVGIPRASHAVITVGGFFFFLSRVCVFFSYLTICLQNTLHENLTLAAAAVSASSSTDVIARGRGRIIYLNPNTYDSLRTTSRRRRDVNPLPLCRERRARDNGKETRFN